VPIPSTPTLAQPGSSAGAEVLPRPVSVSMTTAGADAGHAAATQAATTPNTGRHSDRPVPNASVVAVVMTPS